MRHQIRHIKKAERKIRDLEERVRIIEERMDALPQVQYTSSFGVPQQPVEYSYVPPMGRVPTVSPLLRWTASSKPPVVTPPPYGTQWGNAADRQPGDDDGDDGSAGVPAKV